MTKREFLLACQELVLDCKCEAWIEGRFLVLSIVSKIEKCSEGYAFTRYPYMPEIERDVCCESVIELPSSEFCDWQRAFDWHKGKIREQAMELNTQLITANLNRYD